MNQWELFVNDYELNDYNIIIFNTQLKFGLVGWVLW